MNKEDQREIRRRKRVLEHAKETGCVIRTSETGMMAIDRYRLRHLANDKHGGAILVSKLLKHPDRLLGLILLGNTLANIAAAALATVIAIRLFGEPGILIAPVLLTIVILIFAEVAPKTVAAIHPAEAVFGTPAGRSVQYLSLQLRDETKHLRPVFPE